MYPTLQQKLQGLLDEDSLTFAEKNKLRQLIGILPEFNSSWFRKTTMIKVPKHEKEFIISEDAVMQFFKPVIEKKEPTIYLDKDIWNWFTGQTLPGMVNEFILTVYCFLKTITHMQILQEGEAKGIKHIGTYLDALATIRTAILADEVEQRGTGIIAYFKVFDIDTLYRFYAWRDNDDQLYVSVNKIAFGFNFAPGRGVAFGN